MVIFRNNEVTRKVLNTLSRILTYRRGLKITNLLKLLSVQHNISEKCLAVFVAVRLNDLSIVLVILDTALLDLVVSTAPSNESSLLFECLFKLILGSIFALGALLLTRFRPVDDKLKLLVCLPISSKDEICIKVVLDEIPIVLGI